MSRMEWESGEFKLSVAAWRIFKRAWRDRFNRYQDQQLDDATLFWERCKTGTLAVVQQRRDMLPDDAEGYYFLFHKRLPNGNVQSDGRTRPRKPIRKDFPRATNKTEQFPFGEAQVTLRDTERTIYYGSGDNNHACINARTHPLGRAFFRLLDAVEWSRGTGGKIIGNDECNRESTEDGGGGNYTKVEYGPKVKRQTARSPAYGGYYN